MSKHGSTISITRSSRWIMAAVMAAGLSVAAAGQSARATTTQLGVFTLAGFNAGDGNTNPLNAKVIFAYDTSSNGNLDVTIENNSTPLSDAELIRNILFQASNGGTSITPSGSVTAYLPNGATELTDKGGGSYSTNTVASGSSTALTDSWSLGTGTLSSSTYFSLTSDHTVSGKPVDFVGPSIVTGSSPYSNYADGNSSVQNSSPIIAGPVTFEVNIPGLTSTSAISNVLVGYGTSVGYSTPLSGGPTPTPEPSVLAFLGMGAVGSLMFLRKKH